jgi:hypothetical protein
VEERNKTKKIMKTCINPPLNCSTFTQTRWSHRSHINQHKNHLKDTTQVDKKRLSAFNSTKLIKFMTILFLTAPNAMGNKINFLANLNYALNTLTFFFLFKQNDYWNEWNAIKTQIDLHSIISTPSLHHQL